MNNTIRKIPAYFIVAGIMELFWLIFSVLYHRFIRTTFTALPFNQEFLTYLLFILLLFYATSVLFVGYIRRYMLDKPVIPAIFRDIFFFTLAIGFSVYLLFNVSLLNYIPAVYIVSQTVFFTVGVIMLYRFCTDRSLADIIKRNRTFWIVACVSSLVTGLLFYFIYGIQKKSILVQDNHLFRMLIVMSIVWILVKAEQKHSNIPFFSPGKHMVGYITASVAIFLLGCVQGVYLNISQNIKYIKYIKIEEMIQAYLYFCCMTIIGVVLFVALLSRKFHSRKAIIGLYLIRIAVSLIYISVYSLRYGSAGTSYRTIAAIIYPFILSVFSDIIIVAYLLKSKNAKDYFKMKKIKAVLFDLDGTLINTIDDLSDAVNYALTKAAYPLHEVSEYKLMVGNGMRKLIERALPEDLRDDATIRRVLADFMEYYNAHSVDKTVPYEGLPEIVKEIRKKGYLTAVVTNKEEKAAKQILSSLYPDSFDLIIGQRDDLPPKPDPAAALLAMKTLGVTSEECIFIGDSGVDIETAVNSGAFPVGVLWGFREEPELRENGAKAIVSNPKDILQVLV